MQGFLGVWSFHDDLIMSLVRELIISSAPEAFFRVGLVVDVEQVAARCAHGRRMVLPAERAPLIRCQVREMLRAGAPKLGLGVHKSHHQNWIGALGKIISMMLYQNNQWV